jgi:hypothetical protein
MIDAPADSSAKDTGTATSHNSSDDVSDDNSDSEHAMLIGESNMVVSNP